MWSLCGGFGSRADEPRIASADAQHPTDQSQGGAQQPLARLKGFRPGSPSRSFWPFHDFFLQKPTRNSAYTVGSRWYLRCILAASTLVYVCLRVEAKRPCKGKGPPAQRLFCRQAWDAANGSRLGRGVSKSQDPTSEKKNSCNPLSLSLLPRGMTYLWLVGNGRMVVIVVIIVPHSSIPY